MLISVPKVPKRICRLSPREMDIMMLFGYGFTATEIAKRLRISTKTVETHKGRSAAKLRIHPSKYRKMAFAVALINKSLSIY